MTHVSIEKQKGRLQFNIFAGVLVYPRSRNDDVRSIESIIESSGRATEPCDIPNDAKRRLACNVSCCVGHSMIKLDNSPRNNASVTQATFLPHLEMLNSRSQFVNFTTLNSRH